MAELVDASDSKSDSARSAGSIPARGTKLVLSSCMIRWKPGYVAPFVALMGLVVANNAVWAYS